MDELERYRRALGGVEQRARELAWADRRPWRVGTHVGVEGPLVVVDLHDLGAGLARDVVREVLAQPPPASGAVLFVHGRGRHLGATGALRGVVVRELQVVCAEVKEWSYRHVGGARVAWITDWDRAPSSVTEGSGLGWSSALWIALAAAFAVAVAHRLGLLP